MTWLAMADSLVDDGIIEWKVEGNSPEEAFEKAYGLASKNPYADEGTIEVMPDREDKQLICDKLLEVLKVTMNLHDLMDLKYDPEYELVYAVFPKGTKQANVACDSGTAMIKDIIAQII